MGTKISAKIIADSKNEAGNRITTMLVTFPRIILAEFNTHRMFSRNTASSRAIPFDKMLKSIEEDPFIPIAWQKDHKGMQGTEYITDQRDLNGILATWKQAKEHAIQKAKDLNHEGNGCSAVTKQICNRLLEPFMWSTVIITATEWENFFALRCPKYQLEPHPRQFRSKKDLNHALKIASENTGIADNSPEFTKLDWLEINKGQAEIHMMALAEAMWDAYNESVPKELKNGEWHIPFNDKINGHYLDNTFKNLKLDGDHQEIRNEIKIKIATGLCARVSYTVVGEEKEPNYENDIKLHDRLLESKHMSPFEHCAQAMREYSCRNYPNDSWSGNFKGFIQYRKTIPNENITK